MTNFEYAAVEHTHEKTLLAKIGLTKSQLVDFKYSKIRENPRDTADQIFIRVDCYEMVPYDYQGRNQRPKVYCK